ncbi:MAG: Eco57I restriction-modification methylase domain-containing protein [Akkermansia sp.]
MIPRPRKNTNCDIIHTVCESTEGFINAIPKTQRKKYGQFFTSKETAEFMASMFSIDCRNKHLSILDAGAGSGILSAALVARIQSLPQITSISLTCYETDDIILPLLEQNLRLIQEHSDIPVDFKLLNENYIISQEAEFNQWLQADANAAKYDLIIGNPPYKKLPKQAPEAKAMERICYGAPNLYFLFAAMGIFNLKEAGELVYIIPRSWTSGAYFKLFRQYLCQESILTQMHLFASRKKVFESEDVLQETMIIKLRKSKEKQPNILITSSANNRDFADKTSFLADYGSIVSPQDNYVFLATNAADVAILQALQGWRDTLPSIGLKMKTGLTVHFRNRELLQDECNVNNVPLFYAQHIKEAQVIFPVGKEGEYIETSHAALLQENSNYLFVKRFTSKEESRRLQCAPYFASDYPDYHAISTDNKINFICGASKLSESVVWGLFVIFNSTIYDQYYRLLNGSTQVNSSEINAMPMPPLHLLEAMGDKMASSKDFSITQCDHILGQYL